MQGDISDHILGNDQYEQLSPRIFMVAANGKYGQLINNVTLSTAPSPTAKKPAPRARPAIARPVKTSESLKFK